HRDFGVMRATRRPPIVLLFMHFTALLWVAQRSSSRFARHGYTRGLSLITDPVMLKLSPSLNQLDPAEAWKPRQPSSDQPWNLKWAGHLSRRAALCPSWEELRQALKQGFEPTLQRLLAGGEGLEDFDELVDESAQGLG